MSKSNTDMRGWADVIRTIPKPLRIFALIVLALHSVPLILAPKASGQTLTILIVGVLLLLFILIVVATWIIMRSQTPQIGMDGKALAQPNMKYDVFLSSPMAALSNDEQYKKDREKVLAVMKALRIECKFNSCVYAGNDIESMEKFQQPDDSLKDDFRNLRESKYFILLYPAKLASSVLLEAGWALAFGKPSIYFVRNIKDLPFLLQQAGQTFNNVKIYECEATDDILKVIKQKSEKLFQDTSDVSSSD
ncbi:MAG: hypothetical protein ACYS17_12430 [Planctomycetota bacterium]|jgi:hypothetical protein